jgi:GNAT superfamily N-acetyltransferase
MPIAVAPLVDPDQLYEIKHAAWIHEVPDIPPVPRASALVAFRNDYPGMVTERHVGLLDGEAVGVVELSLPQYDNLDTVNLELWVRPDRRRRGAGRALYAHAAARTRALGRKLLWAETVRRHPDGEAFALAVGATAALAETRSRLDVDPADLGRLDGLLADAWRHAGGYRLVQWTGVPPDDVIDDVAYLDGRLNADAPTGDLEVEPEKVDADRIRGAARVNLLRGRIGSHTGAVHEATGRMIAFTTLRSEGDVRWQAWQNITIVDPGHRGHRLGLIIKIENLRYARRHSPELSSIDTFNASSNAHMLAINTTMGFHPVDSWTQWQQTV